MIWLRRLVHLLLLSIEVKSKKPGCNENRSFCMDKHITKKERMIIYLVCNLFVFGIFFTYLKLLIESSESIFALSHLNYIYFVGLYSLTATLKYIVIIGQDFDKILIWKRILLNISKIGQMNF